MNSNLIFAFSFSLFLSVATYGYAIDGTGYERAGLINEWFTQVEVGARSRIVNMELQINEDKTTRYYLVEYGNTVERISQYDLNAFGEEFGIEGAEEWANIRKEIIMAELAVKRRSDIKVSVRPIALPKSTIYIATSRGRIIAIDADTGEHTWHTSVGNSRYKTTGLGASKNHIAVVNGSTVYCLSAKEGKVLWQKDCQRSPSAPPSVSEFDVFVPLVNGRLEVFSIRGKGKFSKSLLSYGPSITKPLLTSETVSWATRDGFYAVAPHLAKSIQFRLDTGDKFVGGGADGDKTIFVNTVGGSVFALDEVNGSVLWEYSTGDRITSTPFVRPGSVYVISAENRLYRFDSNRGLPAEGWEEPIEGISQYVGMSKDKIYALDPYDRLVVLDAETGNRVAAVQGQDITMVLPNTNSDRLYLGTSSGQIRCFREAENTYPIFHADLAETLVNANRTKKPEKMEKRDSTAPTGEDDPFATADEDDPFASAEQDDPFASDDNSSDDPFSSDDSSDEEGDPFGGDDSSDDQSDPFGGGDSSGDDEGDPFGGDDSSDDEGDPFGGSDEGDESDPFGGSDEGDEDPFGGR